MKEECKKVADELKKLGKEVNEQMVSVKRAANVLKVLDALLCEYRFDLDKEANVLKIRVFPAVSYDAKTFNVSIANGDIYVEDWKEMMEG